MILAVIASFSGIVIVTLFSGVMATFSGDIMLFSGILTSIKGVVNYTSIGLLILFGMGVEYYLLLRHFVIASFRL